MLYLQPVNDPLEKYANLINFWDNPKKRIAIDKAHNALIFGSVLSAKPKHVLEIGIGTGFVTRAVVCALEWNGCGRLTSIDHAQKTNDVAPQVYDELRNMGVEIIISTEGDFIKKQQPNTYDFLISDADHQHALDWLDETLAMMMAGSIMFWHDTNNTAHLMQIESMLNNRKIPFFHFKRSSRIDERCERGMVMAFKK